MKVILLLLFLGSCSNGCGHNKVSAAKCRPITIGSVMVVGYDCHNS